MKIETKEVIIISSDNNNEIEVLKAEKHINENMIFALDEEITSLDILIDKAKIGMLEPHPYKYRKRSKKQEIKYYKKQIEHINELIYMEHIKNEAPKVQPKRRGRPPHPFTSYRGWRP